MSKQILKYPINVYGSTRLALPVGSKFLHVAFQSGVPHVWVECTDYPRIEECILHSYFTGNVHDDVAEEYLATALALDGSFVIHVYERFES
jgi:hypothetical protein